MSEYNYVVLSSNDSLHLYPNNTMSNFRVKLGWRMRFKGTWEVGLVRCSFTNSLCSFNKPQSIYIKEDGKDEGVEVVIAPQRFHSVEHLIKTITATLRQEVSVGPDDRMPKLGLDSHGRVRRFDGMINGKKHVISFSPGLSLLLGLEREGFHYLDAYKTDLYVYIDCIKSRIVGDANVPLLTTIDIGNRQMQPGEQTIIKIDSPEYTPLSHNDINEIEVQILDDTGHPPQFEFGVLSVTLHFRER